MRLSFDAVMGSLEPLRPGSASATHHSAIHDGLAAKGVRVKRIHADANSEGALSRLRVLFRVAVASIASKRLYARWHVLDVTTLPLALMGVRVVLEVNGTTEDIIWAHPSLRPFRRLLNAIASLQFRSASAVIVVSPGLSSWVQSLSQGKASVQHAPNGGNLDLSAHRAAPEHPPYAIFLGELAQWQGMDTILRARSSADWPQGLDLVVVGDGALRPEVEKAASGGRIRYLGRLPHDEAIVTLARAVVSLSPQSFAVERNAVMGRPLKLSESLILGVPCVATGFPDTVKLLEGIPGCHTIPKDDPQLLARAVASASSMQAAERDEVARAGKARCSWREAIDAAYVALFEPSRFGDL